MAYADLSVQAKEGFVYAAKKLSDDYRDRAGATIPNPADPTGPEIPRPDLYPDGKAYMDFEAEIVGCRWYETKMEIKKAKRIATLDKPANAALAAQVDALP